MFRRLLRVVLATAASLALLEGASWLAYRIAFHEPFGYVRLAELRAERIAAAGRVAGTGPASAPAEIASLVPHPFLGFVYNPRFDPEGMRKVHSVPVSEWGFLDDKEPFRPPSDDEVVVGIFGGSVAFWFSVQGVDALLEELARIPEYRGKRLVVVRTALGGSKQPQQLMTLNYLLALGARFDLVINLDGFNEVALALNSEMPKGVFPFYPRGWPDLLGAAGDPQAARLLGRVLYLEELAGQRAALFSGPVLRRSVFAGTLWRALDRGLAGDLAKARADYEAHRTATPAERRDYAAVGPRRQYADFNAIYRDLAGVWGRSSLQMHRLCAANGIRYFHFLQPNQYLPGTKPIGPAERAVAFWPGASYERDVPGGYPLLQGEGRELAAQGVAFTDLTRVFADVQKPLYTDSCCHFSPEGSRILGHAMGRSIAAAMLRP